MPWPQSRAESEGGHCGGVVPARGYWVGAGCWWPPFSSAMHRDAVHTWRLFGDGFQFLLFLFALIKSTRMEL